MRLQKNLPNIRSRTLLKEFKFSMKMAKRKGLFVNQFAILRNHIHLIVEAKNNHSLANGMRSLSGRFGKSIRKHISKRGSFKRRGAVFNGRYFVKVVQSSLQMKNVLRYVLLNSAKHQKMVEHLDPFSSAPFFKSWRKLIGQRFTGLIEAEVETARAAKLEEISISRSWLGSVGWKRA